MSSSCVLSGNGQHASGYTLESCEACPTLVTTTTVPASFAASGIWNKAECMLGSNFWPNGENFSTPFCFKACFHNNRLVGKRNALDLPNAFSWGSCLK